MVPLIPAGDPGPLASIVGASKYYGSFAALADVSLDLRRGEVHMLLGENGAGKSTVVGILIGALKLDRGVLKIDGTEPVRFSPLDARERGINAVLQDFSLAPALTVAENYFLGREVRRGPLLKKAAMRRATTAAIAKLGLSLDADQSVGSLTRPEQQIVEILRALGGKPGALILDEPTAALSHKESEQLIEIVRHLRAQGWAILYITHRMEEIRRVGDRVTVLRDGRVVGVHDVPAVSDETLVQEMIGRSVTTFYPTITAQPRRDALALVNASSADGKFRDVSIRLRYGEIVGLGGLVGCGKEHVARALFGLTPLAAGHIVYEGQVVKIDDPRHGIDLGIVYLPQDRRGEGLALNRSILENLTIEAVDLKPYRLWGFLRQGKLRDLADGIIARLGVRPPARGKPVEELSGGNQQKVVLGRAISRERKVYIFDEPTSGIDVGARLDFYREMQRLCDGGAAILLVTSDLQELIHLSHRIYVMHAGSRTAHLGGNDMTEENVARASFGEALGATAA